MKINVKLSSPFTKYSHVDNGEFDLEVECGITVDDLMLSLGIPQEIERQYFVNGRHAKVTTILNHGDKVIIFPLVIGG